MPPWTAILTKWCVYVAKWAGDTHSFISSDGLTLFIHTLDVYVKKFEIPPVTLSSAPPAPPPTAAQLRFTNRHLRKLQRAEELYTELAELRAQVYLLIFTDRSSEDDPGVRCIPGYGIATESGIRVTNYMPLHLRQTNNAPELYAAVRALQNVCNTRIAICTDSEYVLLGAHGAAKRWQCRLWRGSSGKMAYVRLWQTSSRNYPTPTGKSSWSRCRHTLTSLAMRRPTNSQK